MGQLLYNNKIFSYDEANHKNILEILNDNSYELNDKEFSVKILCGNVVIDGMVSSMSSETVLAANCIPIGEISISDLPKLPFQVFPTTPVDLDINNALTLSEIGLALEIGTTTLAVYFYDLLNKELITIITETNKQVSYGKTTHDRYLFSSTTCGEIDLQDTIINQINSIIMSTSDIYNFSPKQITKLVITGNTLMEHFASRTTIETIDGFFQSANSHFGIIELCTNIGINANQTATAYITPCASPYIGGNVISGMLAYNMDKAMQPTLFINLSTNGEVTLKIDNKIYCSRTFSAFEAINITHGVRRETGAIYSVFPDPFGGFFIKTVHDTEPIGICGTGLLDAVTVLLNTGKVSKNGVLKDCSQIKIADNIYLNQQDINVVLRSKACINATISVLLEKASIEMPMIENIFIDSQYGNNLNLINICELGILPKTMLSKICTLGDASGIGSAYTLLHAEGMDRLQSIADQCECINPSDILDYSDRIKKNLHF